MTPKFRIHQKTFKFTLYGDHRFGRIWKVEIISLPLHIITLTLIKQAPNYPNFKTSLDLYQTSTHSLTYPAHPTHSVQLTSHQKHINHQNVPHTRTRNGPSRTRATRPRNPPRPSRRPLRQSPRPKPLPRPQSR